LQQAPEFHGLFGYDEMACTTMLMRPLADDPAFKPRPLTDEDTGIVQTRLQRLALKRLGRDIAHQAVSIVARETSYHPVRNYLESLTWDGAERLPLFFPAYFGTLDTPYEREIGRMFLIRPVAVELQLPNVLTKDLSRVVSARLYACISLTSINHFPRRWKAGRPEGQRLRAQDRPC
jgi:hypothetical protein